jgi:hypothetical protein
MNSIGPNVAYMDSSLVSTLSIWWERPSRCEECPLVSLPAAARGTRRSHGRGSAAVVYTASRVERVSSGQRWKFAHREPIVAAASKAGLVNGFTPAAVRPLCDLCDSLPRTCAGRDPLLPLYVVPDLRRSWPTSFLIAWFLLLFSLPQCLRRRVAGRGCRRKSVHVATRPRRSGQACSPVRRMPGCCFPRSPAPAPTPAGG